MNIESSLLPYDSYRKQKFNLKTKDLLLFILCSFIWGTTWFIIRFQIDGTSPIVGVFYRFVLATLIMFALNLFLIKKNLRYPLHNHLFFILQGIFNFSINYILTYMAETKISSGMVAITFTSLIYFNMLGLKIWYKKPISKNLIWGSIIGLSGIGLIFSKDLANFNINDDSMLGIFIGIIATFSASLGNMFAFKNHTLKIPVMTFNLFGMLYGALFSLTIGLITAQKFSLPTSPTFLISLLYLATIGTVLAFWAYQTLVGHIGADKAAYTSTISPIIALIVSSFFEKTDFSALLVLGITLCIIGNIVSLKKN